MLEKSDTKTIEAWGFVVRYGEQGFLDILVAEIFAKINLLLNTQDWTQGNNVRVN